MAKKAKRRKLKLWLPLKLFGTSDIKLQVSGRGVWLRGHLELPEGCKGVLFAFKTKTAARKFCSKKVKFLRVEED